MRSVMRSKRSVTSTRAPGPAESSSAIVGALNPLTMRLFSGVEFSWIAPCAQWWLVTTRPWGETKLAVQPPSETTALIGGFDRSDRSLGSPWNPEARIADSISGSCEGSHMPSSARAAAGSRAAARARATGLRRMGFPVGWTARDHRPGRRRGANAGGHVAGRRRTRQYNGRFEPPDRPNHVAAPAVHDSDHHEGAGQARARQGHLDGRSPGARAGPQR